MVIHLFLRIVTQGCRIVGLDGVAKGELNQQLVGWDSSLPGWKQCFYSVHYFLNMSEHTHVFRLLCLFLHQTFT